MRIAVCEDLPEETRLLREMIDHYLKANSLDAEIECFGSGEEFLSAFEPGKYQIIFMDIYMKEGGLTGMEAAEKASRADRDAAIIFVTTSEEYILAGYSLAEFYIVKPVQYEKLCGAMEKCRTQIERFAKTIEVVVDRYPVQIRLRNIYCVESIKHSCIFTTEAHEIAASKLTMDGLLVKLLDFPFVQCHRSYIVNLLHVKEMRDKEFILKNGRSVPIGRIYQAATQKAFWDYFWNKVQGETV